VWCGLVSDMWREATVNIFIGYLPSKSPTISGYFVDDLQCGAAS